MTMERRTCGDSGGRKRDGEPCISQLGLSASGLCLNHDPERRDLLKAARAAGGRARGVESKRRRDEAIAVRNAQKQATAPNGSVIPDDVPPPPQTLEDAVKFFAYIAHAVATGRMDARTGHEASYSLNGFKAAAEKRDMERELVQLRKELAARTGNRPARVS